MRYHALACDYDGTLASDGRVGAATVDAIRALRASGRRAVMVTGRQVEDLLAICPDLDLFDLIVAENGAVLYAPATRQARTLAEPPPPELVRQLRQRGVEPLDVGRVIVATERPHEVAALEVIQQLGLELQVIFNKGSVMILPSGVNKATGLSAGLNDLGLSPHNVVAIGDAENDHALLASCECAVAVANAVPTLRQRADLVTTGDHGDGVRELITRLIDSDLAEIGPALERHDVPIGIDADGHTVRLPAYGGAVLVVGTTGGGKSALMAGLIERLGQRLFQHGIIDSAGRYADPRAAVMLGNAEHAPELEEISEIFHKPKQNAVISLLAVSPAQRPPFFASLVERLQELRAGTGRPHWMVVDEIDQLWPAGWDLGALRRDHDLMGLLLMTSHVGGVPRPVLSAVDAIISIGRSPAAAIRRCAETLGEPSPPVPDVELQAGEAVVWWRSRGQAPVWLRSLPAVERAPDQRPAVGAPAQIP
jgi:HAD superfamily hydrolase (TIGR01484 family)